MKKSLQFLVASALLWGGAATAQAEIVSGECGADGANVTWKLDTETGVLEISGTGAMENFSFSGYGMTSVTIGTGVKTIGDEAFYECSRLTSVTIPNSVTTIGERAFSGCEGLTEITIPERVTTIGGGAFSECWGLKEVWFNADSCVQMGVDGTHVDPVFQRCSSLTTIHIGANVKQIPDNAFYGCSGLTEITIPNSVTTIGNNAFLYCKSLTSVTIPNSVTTIGSGAFSGCESLTSVTIPESVTAIGNSAFSGGNSLTEVWFNADSCISGGFGKCYTLTTVHIGVNVKRIPDYAFSACYGLTSITIPNSVTTIGNYAFENCTGLTSVMIGKSVQTIGYEAFSDCTGLKSVTAYNPEPVDIGYVFDGVDGVDRANCTLYVPAESVELYKAAAGWSEFGEILPIDESSAITETQQEQAAERITVYNLQGVLVLETDDAADLKTLQNGAYIVNGKTMIIAR